MKSVKRSAPSTLPGAGTGGAASPAPPRSPAPQPPSGPRPGARRPITPTGGQGATSGREAGGGRQEAEPPEQEEEAEEPGPPRGSYNLPQDADAGGGVDGDDGERVQCGTCGRRFLPDAYEKHSRVCAKVFAGKRKVFNSAKARVAGTDAAAYNRTTGAGKGSTSKPGGGGGGGAAASSGGGGGAGSVPKWKAQSEMLRAAMANMRDVKAALARGEDIRNIPVVPSAPDPSLVQCPHCGRRFNENAASRHIPSCANTQAKPKFLKAGTGGSGKGAPQSKKLPVYGRV